MKQIKTIFIIIFSLIALSSANAQTLNDGLVAYYPFNGNANDESGNGKNGTLQGDAQIEDGILNLDGRGDFVSFERGPVIPFDSNFTVSLWADTRSLVGYKEMVSQDPAGGPPFFLGVSIDGHIRLSVDGINSSSVMHRNDGLMHLIVLVVNNDDTRTQIYYDGQLAAEYRNKHILKAGGGGAVFRIGTQHSGIAEYFDGRLDDIRIYNRALSDSEVSALYGLTDSQDQRDNQIIALQNSLTEKISQITSLQADQAILNATVTQKNTEITSLEDNVTTLKTAVDQKETQISSLEESLTAKVARINSLEGNVDTLNAAMTQKDTEITSLEDNVTALNIAVDQNQETLLSLAESLTDKVTRINSLEENVATLSQRPTVQDLQDARPGSVVLRTNPQNNSITIDLIIEESSDLVTWTPLDGLVSRTFPLTQNKKFYLFALDK